MSADKPTITDTERLDWLEKREYSLKSHRERCQDGWAIWWTVQSRVGRLRGHPQSSPRTAIDAAIEMANGR